ncbi:MAG: rhodanese-like domain-containing protein [Actinomycetota bacterium]
MHEANEPDVCAPSAVQVAHGDGTAPVPLDGDRDLGPLKPGPVRVIEADELKGKLDRGDDFKLVNALGEWEFRAKHIPGSLHFGTAADAFAGLDPADDIVVYCSNPLCRASLVMYRELEKRGYGNLRRFAGGIAAWEDAGYPLEGEWMDADEEPAT